MIRELRERFESWSTQAQAWAIVAVALVSANALAFVFYTLFFEDRLLLDLVFTSVIVITVGWPLAHYFMRQQGELRKMTARLRRAVRFDDLTGLSNRKTFISEATALIGFARKDRGAGALLFLDVDRFKSINDTFGHAVGDRVLKSLATAIRGCIREGDLAGRLGGEEFAVFLVDADREEARRISERIRLTVREIAGGLGLDDRVITISIGLAMHSPREDIDETLKQADHNLYAAKRRGRDLVVDDDPDLQVA